ncbi:MAG: hypothetical protein GY834_08565 [Bacteroidetes bacterium]|nr:hypothetical protein [Bacteroidota bacterium]
MNKLIITFLLLNCFLTSNSLSAQKISFNVKGSINYPFIKDITSEPTNIQLPGNTSYYSTFLNSGYIETYKESIGGNVIFNFAKSFSEIYGSGYIGNNYISNSKYNIFSIGISYHFTNNKERANY